MAHHPQFSRRDLLATGLAAGAGSLVPSSITRAEPTAPSAARRVLRFAHPTDIHVQPELRAPEGMGACFRHMMALTDPPSLIITGGDLPMDTASTPEARSRVEWELFKKVLADSIPSSMPIHHAIGNHDVFGRDAAKSGATGNEPFFGKRWFMDNFHYDRTYRSFDSAGWRFFILDSIHLRPGGRDFVGRIDAEQLEWFRRELGSTPAATPVVVITHVPIVSVANYFDRDDADWKTDSDTLDIKSSRMHVDCRDLDALLWAHPNVKLCLSGHLHLLDRCEYNGVTHICDGAVSGAKWKGPKRQTPEGYGLIDLFDDGSFRHQYMTFGWRADPDVKPSKSEVRDS